MPIESVRDDIAQKDAPQRARNDLNTVDLLLSKRDNAVASISKEPVNLALSAIVGTEAGTITKLLIDRHIYKDYGIPTQNPLLSKNPFTQAPEWINKGQSSWLAKQFEASSATATAREASHKYLAEKLARSGLDEAALKSVEVSTKMLNVMGRSGTEMILGPGTAAESTASMKAALLKLDAAKLKGLGEIELGIVNEARELALFEAKLANSLGTLRANSSKAALALARPDLVSQGTTVKIGLRDGAIAVGANLVLDAGAKVAADYCLGPNSELGKILEPNAAGLGLSTFGFVVGADRRSKLAYAGAGWLVGKAFNYLGSETETAHRAQFTPFFKDKQKVADLIENYGKGR